MAKSQVTVRVPEEVKEFALRVADETGRSLSAVVAEAMADWVRTKLWDEYLLEWKAENGPFDEEELKVVAREHGMPYVAPFCRTCAA